MNLLPWHRFELQTALDINAVLERLRGETETPAFLPGRRMHQAPLTLFRGTIGHRQFRIRIRGPFSFSPMPDMCGKLEETEGGTNIRVEMVPATWLMWILAGVSAVLSVILFDRGPQVYALVAAMIPFGWFLTTAGFLLDGGESQRKFETLLTE